MSSHLSFEGVDAGMSAMPGVETEIANTFKGLVVDEDNPRTVLHALYNATGENQAITAAEITAITGLPGLRVERTLAMLGVSGWALEFPDNGFTKYVLCVPRD